jgi:hypothetical protein
MKFEFVGFYESTEETKKRRGKNILGTVHIYCVDCELDIRGIAARKAGQKIYFNVPFFLDIDKETGESVQYPLVRFTNQKTHEELMNFLKNEVQPQILETMKNKG